MADLKRVPDVPGTIGGVAYQFLIWPPHNHTDRKDHKTQ